MRTVYIDKDIPRMLLVKALRPLWPGVIWSRLSSAQVVDLPDPILPGARWLRVRNVQCGICATDLSLLKVKADPGIAPAALPGTSRFFLGHEVVSEVVEAGHKVSRFKLGDRVVMESRFAGPNCHTQEIEPPCRFCARGQTRLCENGSVGVGPVGAGGGWGDTYTAHESELWSVPDDISDDQASLIEPMAVALHGVLRRPPRPGEKALVIGSGIIGLLTLQAARVVEPEAEVSVMARYPHQAEMARILGADRILDETDGYGAVTEITEAKLYRAPMNRGMILGGYDVVYDTVGSSQTVHDGLRWARAGGALVLVGISMGMARLDLNPVWYQEVDLVGSHTYGIENWKGRQVHTFDLVIEMLQEGVLQHEGLITHRFPFDQLKRAIAVASDKKSGSIKVTLDLE